MTLKAQITSDLPTFLNTDEFAIEAMLQSGAKINVIFDIAGLAIGIQGTEISTANPQALCRASDVESAAFETTITINAVVYKIKDKTKSEDGLTTMLALSKD